MKLLIILAVVLLIGIICVIGGVFDRNKKKDEIYPLY